MKREIILTLLTFIFLSIGAYFCYKKKIEINDIKSPVNSFLYINYDNNYINSNIDFLDKKTTLKSKAYITYETNGSSDVCLNYILKADGNYDKTEGVDENNKELTFLIEGLSKEKEIPSFEKDDEIILYTFKVKPNTHEEYNIITNFYINNLDQSELTNNSIDFTYFVKQTNC